MAGSRARGRIFPDTGFRQRTGSPVFSRPEATPLPAPFPLASPHPSPMPRLSTRTVLAALFLLGAAPAAAQDAAGTLPFRRGQWGAEFSATTSVPAESTTDDELRFAFPSVGFLRF